MRPRGMAIRSGRIGHEEEAKLRDNVRPPHFGLLILVSPSWADYLARIALFI